MCCNSLDAKLHSYHEIGTEEIVLLTPDRGNIHSFKAVENTAILDVLLPNYDHKKRFCNFYYPIKEEDNPKSMIHDLKGENTVIEGAPLAVKLKYGFPPEDMDINILEYQGEAFEK